MFTYVDDTDDDFDYTIDDDAVGENTGHIYPGGSFNCTHLSGIAYRPSVHILAKESFAFAFVQRALRVFTVAHPHEPEQDCTHKESQNHPSESSLPSHEHRILRQEGVLLLVNSPSKCPYTRYTNSRPSSRCFLDYMALECVVVFCIREPSNHEFTTLQILVEARYYTML